MDIIIIVVVLVLLISALTYIYLQKKKGSACVGCSYSKNCQKKDCYKCDKHH